MVQICLEAAYNAAFRVFSIIGGAQPVKMGILSISIERFGAKNRGTQR